jgi:hypothetical protein
MVAYATIDLGALRACRRKTGLSNVLVRQPFQAYAESYRQTAFHPANLLLDGGTVRGPERREFTEWQQADIQRLVKKNIL